MNGILQKTKTKQQQHPQPTHPFAFVCHRTKRNEIKTIKPLQCRPCPDTAISTGTSLESCRASRFDCVLNYSFIFSFIQSFIHSLIHFFSPSLSFDSLVLATNKPPGVCRLPIRLKVELNEFPGLKLFAKE